MFRRLAIVGMTAAAVLLGTTTIVLAETSATPAKQVAATVSATPTPSPFNFKAYVRAYDFTRQNASNGFSKANQQSFDPGISLHGDYNIMDSGFKVGASYFYSNPLNNCTSSASFYTQPCKGAAPGLQPDNTLPGFEMSTLYEAYVSYANADALAKAGWQVVTDSPWLSPSDSRLKPDAFFGYDFAYHLNKNWSAQVGYYNGFEDRVSSSFFRSTLLTYSPVDAPGYTSLVASKGAGGLTMVGNSGVVDGRIGFSGNGLTSNLYYYGFADIANAVWWDAKYALKGDLKPFVAAQFGTESNTGASQVGIISSQVFGLQGGLSFNRNFSLVAGYDHLPSHTATIAGTCPANHVLPTNKGAANYFVASSSYNCTPGSAPGTMVVYYGGWASPYTDSYATDPFFTTSISQGMADRRSFGDAGKIAASFTSNDRRSVTTVSRAFYAYGNGVVGVAPTQETDFDTQYFFKALPKVGSYKGFSLRYRYAQRNQQFAPAGVAPLFKYNRFQAEYDF